MNDALKKLKVKYTAARALVDKCGDTVERLMERRPANIFYREKSLTAADSPPLPTCSRARRWRSSKRLTCRATSSVTKGAAAIAAAAAEGCLPRLKELNLADNQIGAAGMQALGFSFAGGAFRELKVLYIGNNSIGDAGLMALSAALEKDALPELEKLFLHHNMISGEGVKALMSAAGGGRLAKLEELHLDDNHNIGEEGIKALVEAINNDDLPSLNALFVLYSWPPHANDIVNMDAAEDVVR